MKFLKLLDSYLKQFANMEICRYPLIETIKEIN